MPMVRTPRLTLVPFTPGLIEAVLRSTAELGDLLGVQIADGWPNADYRDVLPIIAQQALRNPASSQWSYLALHTADQSLIGDLGGKGGPDDDGVVDIGYSIVPAYQRCGYATEAVQALIAWACVEPGVRQITAECLRDNVSSIRVLEKVGMEQVRADATYLYWELPVRQGSQSI